MNTLLLSREELATRAKALYEESIRAQVETPENIGQMVIIDIETGAYAVDALGIDAAESLRKAHPEARLYGIRIGYRTAEAIGGVLARTAA
jgi:hypothetical protein